MSSNLFHEDSERQKKWRSERIKKNQIYAKNLRSFIDEHFACHADFADHFKINESTLSHYCTGNAKIPRDLVLRMKRTFPDKVKFKDLLEEPLRGYVSIIED